MPMPSKNLGIALIRCEWPGCGRTWTDWRQFSNHRRIHKISDLRSPVMASVVYYREPGAGARQLRAQVDVNGQLVHSVGFVEGEYDQEQASNDGLDMGASAGCGLGSESDSESESNRQVGSSRERRARRRGEGGCPDDDDDNDFSSLSFAKVKDRAGTILNGEVAAAADPDSEIAAESRGLESMEDEASELEFLEPPESVNSSRTLREIARQLVWNRVTEAESKQWLKVLKSEGFESAALKDHSSLHSVMKSTGLLKPHVHPLRVNIGIGEKIY